MENKLPESWEKIALENLELSFFKGINVSSKGSEGEYLFIPSGANFPTGIKLAKAKWISKEEFKKIPSDKILKDKDILFNSGGVGTLGRSSFFRTNGQPVVCDSFIIIIRDEHKQTNMKYLYYWLQSSQAEELIEANTKGTTGITSIKSSDIKSFEIPLPPLTEQHRIVAKLDALMEKVESNKQRLDKIPALLKRFRQSVLAAAVSGKLTKEWRNMNEEVEDAKVLLERLIKKRKESKITVKLDLSISESEGINFPESWIWTHLVNIADIIGGVTKGRKFNGKKTIMFPYLRVANVQDGYLDLREIKEIEVLPEDIEKYKLHKGDILFTEGGDRDKLGRGTIWNNEVKKCIHQNHIFRARVNEEYIVPEYVSFFTKSEVARNYFFENASQTVNLASINLTMLGGVPIALPPIEEQKEIVRRVDQLFVFANKIEARYIKVKSMLDKLRQSILAKAFRGELVPQDPNDEPASVLLEKIKAEKTKISAGKRLSKFRNKKGPAKLV
jgi:type I restriction enzyme S subunit